MKATAGADGGQELLYMNPNRDTVDTTILSYEPAADGSLTHPRALTCGRGEGGAGLCVWVWGAPAHSSSDRVH